MCACDGSDKIIPPAGPFFQCVISFFVLLVIKKRHIRSISSKIKMKTILLFFDTAKYLAFNSENRYLEGAIQPPPGISGSHDFLNDRSIIT
jgi:hypothetical protein